MQLPPRFHELIARDHALNAVVLKALSIVGPWTLDNRTVFFSEYTDHSLKHLSEVLLTAEGLISDESWPSLTAEDGAVMVLSVLLHDCALHLSEDGFFSLVTGEYKSKPSRYVHDEPEWTVLWGEFVAEARRFDQRKLKSLFGSVEPVSDVPLNKLEMTYKHRLLIGEFLRRHHARLAHEISLSGIPGVGAPLELADAEHQRLMDLSGFVARSHNYSMRSAVDCLESTQRRIHNNCRVPFVMMVLRIADYLQIHSSRAPGQLLRLKSLASPISRGEWSKHLSVREINQAHDDPEAIFVDCEPETVATFLGMQHLLRDIQAELDSCWAVLGEVYGRVEPLGALGIAIRRIKSNIDDPAAFSRSRRPAYLPREFKFRTASSELLDLLVAPLYGAKPQIGIRELVQNAVDACRERSDLVSKGVIQDGPTRKDDVVVTLNCPDGEPATLIVEDFGVGMTADVVDHYLLNIGASFRSSDVWRENHESDGRSSVHRTGRFGIGLLAAFLLGPELKVTTRSVYKKENEGLAFVCNQGSDTIEVKSCSFHAGTRIEIQLEDRVAKVLLSRSYYEEGWDWYCLESPEVRRVVSKEGLDTLSQRRLVPACGADLEQSDWRRISSQEYDDVMWRFTNQFDWSSRRGSVVCNGIYVGNIGYKLTPSVSERIGAISPRSVDVVVFDPDGRFPINLQRNDLTSTKTGFEDQLAADISKFFVEGIISRWEGSGEGNGEGISHEQVLLAADLKINGLDPMDHGYVNISPLILCRAGVIPADADLLRMAKLSSITVDASNVGSNQGAYRSAEFMRWVDNYSMHDCVTHTKVSRASFLRGATGAADRGSWNGFFDCVGPVIGRRILVKKSDVEELLSSKNLPKGIWFELKLEAEFGGWGIWVSGRTEKWDFDIAQVTKELEASKSFGFCTVYFETDFEIVDEERANSPFAEAWCDRVGGPILAKD
jgi:molecular chaperone HtpG